MISALCFVPRGAALAEPLQSELSAAEMEQLLAKSAGLSLAELDADEEGAAEATASAAAAAAADGDAEADTDEGAMSDDAAASKKADGDEGEEKMSERDRTLL